MVDAPDNPQASTVLNISGRYVNYAFEHVAPGHYTVLAELDFGINETISVDVGTDTVMADIVSSYGFPHPTTLPDLNASPTNDPSPAQPTPALPGLITLLAVGFMLYYLANKNKSLTLLLHF